LTTVLTKADVVIWLLKDSFLKITGPSVSVKKLVSGTFVTTSRMPFEYTRGTFGYEVVEVYGFV
jgi:hypothetical protein